MKAIVTKNSNINDNVYREYGCGLKRRVALPTKVIPKTSAAEIEVTCVLLPESRGDEKAEKENR